MITRREMLKGVAGIALLGLGSQVLPISKEPGYQASNMVYEDKSQLSPEKDIELEVKSYYSEKDSPRIVFATGLGGCAGRSDLVDSLAENFHVVTFSPRNSGKSNGKFGAQNYISDLKYLIDEQSQIQGDKPLAIGHSFGGYSLARLLEEEEAVKKAVLLAPLTKLSEQNPYLIDKLLKAGSENEYLAGLFGVVCSVPTGFGGVKIGDQRFNYEDFRKFLEELYISKKVDKVLKSPTQVHLAGRTNFRAKIGNLNELQNYWKCLGAEVKIYPDLNHWFSGKGISGVGNGFSLCEENGITSDIKEFFKNSN